MVKEKVGRWIYIFVLFCVLSLAAYFLFPELRFGNSSITPPAKFATVTTTTAPESTKNSVGTSTPMNLPSSVVAPSNTVEVRSVATDFPVPSGTPTTKDREIFNDLNPDTQLLELWRIEHDWDTTAELAYHFQSPFSFDGRYIVSKQGKPLHIFDLHSNQVVKVLRGGSKPSWAHHSHQLFYYNNDRVYRYDVDLDETIVIVEGIGAGYPRTISHDDRYIFTSYGGFSSGNDRINTGEIYRIENVSNASLKNGKVVQLTDDWQYASEPRASSRYDVIVFKQRRDAGDIDRGLWAMAFDGPLEEIHQSIKLLDGDFSLGKHPAWLGSGEFFIMGDESPPKKIRYFEDGAWGEWIPIGPKKFSAGSVAPMGYSGQWLVAHAGNESLINVVDMETGNPTLLAHVPSEMIDDHPGDENRGDPDPHGSPDGTKVAFVSNYDFKNCPATQLTGKIKDNVPVRSTAGFPPAGILAVRHHLVAYNSKTANSFEGITSGALGTEPAVEGTWSDMVVTNFACRSSSNTDLDHQYQQDLYIAVYRLPDTPGLSVLSDIVTISPGENRREIMGYKLQSPSGTVLLTSFPSTVDLTGGTYSISAIEWSGLESGLSNFVTVSPGTYEIVLEK
jgi:hypothetical protein